MNPLFVLRMFKNAQNTFYFLSWLKEKQSYCHHFTSQSSWDLGLRQLGSQDQLSLCGCLPCGTRAPKDALYCRMFSCYLAGKRCSAFVILFVFPRCARAHPTHKACLVQTRVSKRQWQFRTAGNVFLSAVFSKDR